MNNIIQHKNKKTLLIFICILVVLTSSFGCSKRDSAAEQVYSTHEEAILKCLEANDIQTASGQLSNIILNDFKLKDTHYYLLKGVQKSIHKQAVYVYLVGVISHNDSSYTCEKVSADFSLETLDAVNDADYTPYSEYIIPVDDLYIHVGMLFDLNYKPYFNGKQLSLDEDNIFFCKTKEADAEIEIIEK